MRFANRAALDFIRVDAGRSARSCAGRTWSPTRVRRRIERRIAVAPPATASSRTRRSRSRSRAPGAPPAVLELRARLISPPGQPRAYHCIARDVTERRQQERETQQLLFKLREANRLQARVRRQHVARAAHAAERHHRLHRPARRRARPAGRQRGARSSSQRIAAAGRALHRLVESVLEYARLDRGRTVLITTRFPADQAARRAARAVQRRARQHRRGAVASRTPPTSSSPPTTTGCTRSSATCCSTRIKFTGDGEVELRVQRVGDAGRVHRPRHRHRHRRGRARARLRALSPGRRLADAHLRRRRPRPGDRAAQRRAAARPGRGGEPGRRGHDLPGAHSDRRRGRRGCAAHADGGVSGEALPDLRRVDASTSSELAVAGRARRARPIERCAPLRDRSRS